MVTQVNTLIPPPGNRMFLQEISPSFTLITVGYPNVGQSIQVWGNIVNPAELDVGRCDY